MKFLRYALLIFIAILWAIGLSPALLSKVRALGWIPDGYQYGDLYRLSNLSSFKEPRKTCPPYVPVRRAAPSRKTHLYIIGDSFTEKQRVGQQDFAVDYYHYVHWSDFLHIKLDTTRTNILLMESVERHFRQKMETPLGVLIPDTATFVAQAEPARFMNRLDDAFKAKYTEDRLEGLLFQNDFFLTLKEWKADFNHRFFNRVNSAVTLVNDGKDMVYYMDTDTPQVTSSFSKLSKPGLDSIITNLEASRKIAESMGFEHVILSVIPNKVSVLDPQYGAYNRLIERVYQHPGLTVQYIDVLEEFREMGRSSYLRGDSHWTCDAQYIWLEKVNKKLLQLTQAAQNPVKSE